MDYLSDESLSNSIVEDNRRNRLDNVVHFAALLFEKMQKVPKLLRGQAEGGVVEAFKQWCRDAGYDERSALDLLGERIGKSL